ncbi:amino acid adenylation domain-containing protein [Olivibacter sp. SDN3]|nr:amino acid adenylation domain-containing protein [Olivibacter sp. SDN3]
MVCALEAVCEEHADKVALIGSDGKLTYGMLNEQANQLAYYLRGIGLTQKSIVAICLRQSVQRLVAFFAVLKTGAAYLPIDGELPEGRIKMMVEDAEADLTLTEQHFWYKVHGFARVTVAVDKPLANIQLASLPKENPTKRKLLPDSLAYIIYTSGSSGLPKGVMVSHSSLYRFIQAQANILGLTSVNHTLQFASPSFDAAVIDSWVPLLVGATVHLYANNKLVGDTLLDFIVNEGIDTVPLLPPAVLATLPVNRPIGKLHTIAIGGEACTEQTVKAWYQRVRLINSYGPTEATVAVSNYHFKTETDPRIIGVPLPGVKLWLLDDALRPVPKGAVGELYISGLQVALGYKRRPEENAKAFLPMPKELETAELHNRLYRTGDRARLRPDGNMEFMGRKDDQVKIRGYRMELAEIEHHLAKLPQIARAAVTVFRPENGVPALAAFVQPVATEKNKGIGSFPDVRAKLMQVMPAYMVPDKMVVLDELPLNHAGKVDKTQLELPKAFLKKTDAAKRKEGNLTDLVKGIWQDLLDVEDVADDDDFFDLGGHSLLLAQLHVLLPETVRNRISLPELYTYTTVNSFVAEVEKRWKEVELSQKIKTEQTVEELLRDAALPADFVVGDVPDGAVLADPGHILLTGVTGFVGSHLLEELLQNTGADIYCLVRAANTAEARKRIQDTFLKFKLSWQEGYNDRVIPQVGDLSLPNLGMDEHVYGQLADIVEVIYHSGSSVSYVQPYPIIKKPNIDGLHHILHLSVARKVKHLVLLSSMGVFSWGGIAT